MPETVQMVRDNIEGLLVTTEASLREFGHRFPEFRSALEPLMRQARAALLRDDDAVALVAARDALKATSFELAQAMLRDAGFE
jgi:hypothetical protein